jgi:hypothetical protein
VIGLSAVCEILSLAGMSVLGAAARETFSSQAVTISGARPSSKAGSRIEKVQANRSFGRLISASRLPAIASSDRCFGLEASSSASPRRGSRSGGSPVGCISGAGRKTMIRSS